MSTSFGSALPCSPGVQAPGARSSGQGPSSGAVKGQLHSHWRAGLSSWSSHLMPLRVPRREQVRTHMCFRRIRRLCVPRAAMKADVRGTHRSHLPSKCVDSSKRQTSARQTGQQPLHPLRLTKRGFWLQLYRKRLGSTLFSRRPGFTHSSHRSKPPVCPLPVVLREGARQQPTEPRFVCSRPSGHTGTVSSRAPFHGDTGRLSPGGRPEQVSGGAAKADSGRCPPREGRAAAYR